MSNRPVTTLVLASFLTDVGARVTFLAVPLVVLQVTGSAAASGIAAGMGGLPIALSPWWAVRLRQRITSGPALALVALVQAVGVAIVPLSLLVGALPLAALVASGLITGSSMALAGPCQDVLATELADRDRPGRGETVIAVRDLLRRIAVAAGPMLAGVGIWALGASTLLWFETAALLIAATAFLTVRRRGRPASKDPAETRIRLVIREHPDLVRGLVMRTACSVVWFTFGLGMIVIAEQTESPGPVLAATTGGYGVGTLVGAALGAALSRRLPLLPTMVAGWTAFGLSLVGMAAVGPSPLLGLAAVCVLAGVVMSFAIVSINVLITRRTSGPARRTAFSGQLVLMESGLALGMLVGGPVLEAVGPRPSLLGGGIAMLLTCGWAVTWAAPRNPRIATTGQHAPGRASPVSSR